MPDDHSELVPPLPIPNRTVKRLRADDSAATSVKVGNRQACYMQKPRLIESGLFALCVQHGRTLAGASPAASGSQQAKRNCVACYADDCNVLCAAGKPVGR